MKFQSFRLQIFIILLSGLPLLAMSQEIEISASNFNVNHSTTHLHKIIGHDQDHFYALKLYGYQYYLEKLDKNLNPLAEEPIKLFKGIKTYQLEYVAHFHNELYIFVSKTDLTDIVLYYQKINKSNLQPSSDLIEVAKIKCIKGAWANFHFALSRHETKLLIACRIRLGWSKAQFNEFYVFGEDLGLIWKRKDNFEFKGLGPRDNKYIVDETGNVSILSLVKRESILSLIREVKNLFTIYRYSDEGKNFKEYPVTLQERYIKDIRIIGGEQGELICAGLFSDDFSEGITGTFFFKVDPATGIKYDDYLNKFDNGLLKQLAAMKEPMIKNEELLKYVITDMVLRENGKIIVIAEQVFNQPYNTYNNLIVTCYENNGQVYWTRVVEKNQDFKFSSIYGMEVEPSDYRNYIMETGFFDQNIENYCSYALMAPLDKTGIILFFNDDSRNMDQPGRRRNFNRPKKSYILAVAIDEFGNLSRKPLLKWKKRSSFPEPIRFYDTLHETIVIPAFRYRRFNYYKITASF